MYYTFIHYIEYTTFSRLADRFAQSEKHNFIAAKNVVYNVQGGISESVIQSSVEDILINDLSLSPVNSLKSCASVRFLSAL